ncbi:MAG: sulfatase, partial [bacterium]
MIRATKPRRLVLTTVLAVLLGLTCGRTERPTNVIVIGIDTLRPDHLGCYGYARSTSPAIDRLAAGGTQFLNTVSQSSWTLPSFASFFTSLYPHQHGVTSSMSKIRDTFPTMATILKEHGYATGALINSGVLSPELGLSRGFDHYDLAGPKPRLADRTTEQGLEWIDDHKRGPFLLFLHYFDPHETYSPPAPYDTLFDPGYTGRLGRAFVLHDAFPEVIGADYSQLAAATDEDWNHIRALYDGEIAFTDKAVGSLLRGLEERGLSKRTLIVLMGDHGEEFYEHGGIGHGHSMFGEVLRVPLIFSCPGAVPKGRRIAQQVRLIDVMPTVLDLVGVKTNARFEGASLLPLVTGRGQAASTEGALFPPSLAFSEGTLHRTPKASITGFPWKIICELEANRDLFFNTERDPGEHTNLAADRSDAYRSLSELLLKTLFALSDSWYVEMSRGESDHRFDLDIRAAEDNLVGFIHLHRFLDSSDRLVPAGAIEPVEDSGVRLAFEGLTPEGPLTLAFKIHAPPALAVKFDLRIDGKPAPERTFLGEAVTPTRNNPFLIGSGRLGKRAWGQPRTRPTAPYFLVWRAEGRQAAQTAAPLTEDTKRELRALGYIQ